jgi:hypothetical protein
MTWYFPRTSIASEIASEERTASDLNNRKKIIEAATARKMKMSRFGLHLYVHCDKCGIERKSISEAVCCCNPIYEPKERT